MNFSEIVGQQDAKDNLINAIKNKKTSHAYIFSGEEGSGKLMMAEAFAKMLLCDNPEDDSCGECKSCKQAESHNHPDIIYVTHEKSIISVDDIRYQINDDIVLKPYNGKYKIYIVDEAEKMKEPAQNALLKTIEEPPAYAIIILLTTNHNGFLQTILSRCVTIQMKPLLDSQIKRHLMDKYQIVDYQAELLSVFAQGNLGKAIDSMASEDFNDQRNAVLSTVKRIATLDGYEIDEHIKAISVYKDHIEEYLSLMTLWYRDVLLYKATFDESRVVFKEDMFDIKKQAENNSYEGLEIIIKTIDETKKRLQANVNFELALQMLLLEIKEKSR